jgi:hypothetical protein
LSDVFDSIAARVTTHSADAVASYRERQQALAEKLRVSAENAAHRRGVTRASVKEGGAILLPANDIDLSPHTPRPVAEPEVNTTEDSTTTRRVVADDLGVTPPDCPHDVDEETDYSYTTGWLSDR